MNWSGTIDQLSQRLGLNLRYFIRSGSWVTGRYILLGSLSLLTSVAFARLGNPTLYGQYQFVLSIISLFSILTLPGLNTISLRAVAKNDTATLAQASRTSFILSWLLATACFGYGYSELIHNNASVGWSLIASGFLLPFFYGPNAWYTYYEGRLDFRSPTLRILLAALITNTTLIIGLWYNWSLLALIVAYFLLSAVLTCVFYLEIRNKLGRPTQPLSLQLAVSYTLQKASLSVPESVQPLLISWIFGFHVLGIFQLAYTLANSANGFIAALAATYFPLLLKHSRLNHKRIIGQNIALGALLAIAYWLLVRILFIPLYGPSISAGYSLAIFFTGIIALLPLRLYFTSALTAHGAPGQVAFANVVSYLIGIICLVIFSDLSDITRLVTYLYTVQICALIILGRAYINWATHSNQTHRKDH